MERYMYQDDSFERMLKQKADEYRMYPSTQTWNKIQQRVQKKNSLFNIKSAGLTIVFISVFSLYLSNNQEAYTKDAVLSVVNELTQPVASTQIQPAATHFRNKARFVKSAMSEIMVAQNMKSNSGITTSENTEGLSQVAEQKTVENKFTEPVPSIADPVVSEEFLLTRAENTQSSFSTKPALYTTEAPEQKAELIATNRLSESVAVEESPSLKTDAELNYEVNVPVIVKVKEGKKLQLYFTPSISYRVLYAENKFTFGNLYQQDPENAAIHSPALGFEAGASIIFPTSKRIKFITGIQFNYTHYSVNAFNSAPQVTTIRLNYSSIQRVSTLNNNFGYYAKDLANETFQISIPVGVEVKLAGKKKVQWDFATNLQPSYLLKASGYLLTNDLKNYIKAPDLLSHLNLNTSLETFIRWNAGAFALQAGPQLRYQLFSNARGEYPIREHLVDYGFRIGIVKPLR